MQIERGLKARGFGLMRVHIRVSWVKIEFVRLLSVIWVVGGADRTRVHVEKQYQIVISVAAKLGINPSIERRARPVAGVL
jgi:hypothetical protein